MVHKLMYACGFKKGLAHSHKHLKHFYQKTHHAAKAVRHMLGRGSHSTNISRHSSMYNNHMMGHGAGHRRIEEAERPIDGSGMKRHHRKVKPLHFKF